MSTAKDLDVSKPSDGKEQADDRGKWLWILLALFVLSAVIVFISQLEDTVEINELVTPPSLPEVSVVEVVANAEQAEILSLSEVKPRWSVNLGTAVSGKVEKVLDRALTGEPVKKGDLLVEIENSRYVAELAAAEQTLQEARLALLQAENATHLAREDFKRNGQEPPNDLALKLPQLGIARSALTSAEASERAARKQLEDTIIVAPFDAYVTGRYVSPGQIINAGDRLLRLVDRSAFELVTEVGLRDWALLRKPVAGQIAHVLDQHGREIAKAKVRRGGGFLDEQTRLFKLFLDVENPKDGSVLSGDFVSVRLNGVIVERAFDLPASSITQEGYLWHLDGEDRLQRFEPAILFERHDRVVIKAPENVSQWRVAVTPLSSFLPGQTVEPKPVVN
ncbi:MAG: efflux RND transporter periplasmic adaptor subunit [Pseudomonadota bacterium]